MIQPNDLKLLFPMVIPNGVVSSTHKVWNTLSATHEGNLERVKELVEECPELAYAQYNYTPPIHFAVRGGYVELVNYLLEKGAHDPSYRIYPFQDSLLTIAQDRGHSQIVKMLEQYYSDASACKFKGDNGEIHYNRSPLQKEFQEAVGKNDFAKTEKLLKEDPKLCDDETFFWGEGILMMPAKEGNRKLVELLLHYGAKVPGILKWAQFYYFERYDMAAFLLENGMNPNVKSWHHVTLLHDMAQKGDINKVELLLDQGADINAIEEEYQSTPLGMATRWGQVEMVEFLIREGADPNISGAPWSTPLSWSRKKGQAAIEELLTKTGAK
jgi:uncharacterized protein